jgi:hypothetical protein
MPGKYSSWLIAAEAAQQRGPTVLNARQVFQLVDGRRGRAAARPYRLSGYSFC